MNRRPRPALSAALVAVATTVLSLAAATPASAAGTSNFGQHVRTCAQTMGFSGTHNPGMHHGAAGWTGMPCMTG